MPGYEHTAKAWLGIGAAVLIGWLACLGSGPASANGIRPIPLDRQFASADLVVVGRLGGRGTCRVGPSTQICAEILTATLIKGPAAGAGVRRYLILSSQAAELPVDPVVIPDSALLFMARARAENANSAFPAREFYEPVQGRHSIVLLDSLNLTDIQRAMCPLRRPASPLWSSSEISAC